MVAIGSLPWRPREIVENASYGMKECDLTDDSDEGGVCMRSGVSLLEREINMIVDPATR